MGTSIPLSEDYYDFSNDYVQEIFLDKKNSDDTSKELKIGKLGEKEENVNAEKKLERNKLRGERVGCCQENQKEKKKIQEADRKSQDWGKGDDCWEYHKTKTT